MAYNFDRPYKVREERCEELERKACLRAEARFVVIFGYDAKLGAGEICTSSTPRQTFFDDLRTARAYANHASDCYDISVGLYRYEFIEGIDNR